MSIDAVLMFTNYIGMWTSIMLIAIGLFRFSYRKYLKHILISSFLLTSISVWIQYIKSPFLLTIVMPISAVLCCMFILKLRWMHSVLMITLAYTIVMVVEMSVSLMFSSFQWGATVNMIKDYIHLPGWVIVFVNFLFAWTLQKYRLGFTYVNQHENTFRAKDRKLLLATIVSIFIILLTSIILYFYSNFMLYLAILIVYLCFTLLLLSYRKEIE